VRGGKERFLFAGAGAAVEGEKSRGEKNMEGKGRGGVTEIAEARLKWTKGVKRDGGNH